MDVKSMAKTKRAHTQHHTKKPHKIHQSQKLKVPSDGTSDSGTSKKTLEKQAVDKTQRAQKVGSSLPSNWDRYGEEFDPRSEDPSAKSTGRTPDVILPRSKGADYRYLIEEAKSETEQNAYLDAVPSFDDLLSSDYRRGLGSMLAVRGESMLSWVGDDNFVVEDRITATNEASFLSLNLNALAETLVKVDLAKRLFIEPDLLAPLLSTDDLTPTSSQKSKERHGNYASGESKGTPEKLILDDFSVKERVVDQISEEITSDSSIDRSFDRTLLKKCPNSVNYISIDHRGVEDSCQSEDSTSIAVSSMDSSADLSKKSAIFEATSAERELDMLLDSFNETKFLDNTFVPVFHEEASETLSQMSIPCQDPSKTKLKTVNMDDALDDLLKETPNTLDGFDSWFDTIR